MDFYHFNDYSWEKLSKFFIPLWFILINKIVCKCWNGRLSPPMPQISTSIIIIYKNKSKKTPAYWIQIAY